MSVQLIKELLAHALLQTPAYKLKQNKFQSAWNFCEWTTLIQDPLRVNVMEVSQLQSISFCCKRPPPLRRHMWGELVIGPLRGTKMRLI